MESQLRFFTAVCFQTFSSTAAIPCITVNEYSARVFLNRIELLMARSTVRLVHIAGKQRAYTQPISHRRRMLCVIYVFSLRRDHFSPLPRLFTFSLLLPFPILPLALSLGPQWVPLGVVLFLVSAERTHTQPAATAAVSYARVFPRRPDAEGVIPESYRRIRTRARNLHKTENSGGRLRIRQEEGDDGREGMKICIRVSNGVDVGRTKRIQP